MNFLDHIESEIAAIRAAGLYKDERLISGPQDGHVELADDKGGRRRSLVLCSNNYLGLSNHPEVVAAARSALDEFGFGMASVRFICGTQTLHRELELAIASYLQMDDAILFPACFDANGAVFEPLTSAEDAIISDSLNHASIIDGIRLSKAKRYRFANGDMNELEHRLKQANNEGARFKIIATDGVFSMDGYLAKLPEICGLAERYGAMVMVDDCHATGHIGASGRGTPTLMNVADRVTILTGTLGKSLGGAMGGYIAASKPIINLLRQRARPYLFSNSLAPTVVAGSLCALGIAERSDNLREKLKAHAKLFRNRLERAGFELLPGETPIVPVMLHDARQAQALAAALDQHGVYVSAFFFPVVPAGQARIRAQMSAALETSDIEFAADAFEDCGRRLGIIR